MSSIDVPQEVAAALDALDAAGASVRALNLRALSPAVRLRVLERMETARRQQVATSHDLIAGLAPEDAGDLGGPVHKVIGDWLRISYSEACRRIRDARQLTPRLTLTGQPLPPELPATAEAWRGGALDAQHLRVIQTFFRDLPDAVPAVTVDAAERFLARQAVQLRPDQLEKVAHRCALRINPDGNFSDIDRARQRGFTWAGQRSDGMSIGKLVASPELRANLDAWLARFAAPGMCNPDDEKPCLDGEPNDESASGDTRSHAQRQHDAINALVRGQLGNPQLGAHNGLPVTVIVVEVIHCKGDFWYRHGPQGPAAPGKDCQSSRRAARHAVPLSYEAVPSRLVTSGANINVTTPESGLNIGWGILTVILGVVTLASLGTLAVITSVKHVDTLSTIALALAVVSFAAQLIVTMAQGQQSAQVNRETMTALSEMRATTSSLLTNQRDQFDTVLTAALQKAVPAAVEDVSREEGRDPRVALQQTEARVTALENALQQRLAESLNLPAPAAFTRFRLVPKPSDDEQNEWRALLNSYPPRAEGEPVAEILRRLPLQAIAALGEIASISMVSNAPDHSTTFKVLSPEAESAPSSPTQKLIEEGLIDRRLDPDNDEQVIYRLTPTGITAARIMRGAGEPPDWAADFR